MYALRLSKPLASVKQQKYRVEIARAPHASENVCPIRAWVLFKQKTPMDINYKPLINNVGFLSRLVLKGCTYFNGTNFKAMKSKIIEVLANWLISKMNK